MLNLRELREESLMTQAQVAEKMGVTQGYVSKLESKDVMNVGLLVIVRYINAIGGVLDLDISLPQKHIYDSHEIRPCVGANKHRYGRGTNYCVYCGEEKQ